MRDPWFGHRDPLTWLPLPGADKNEWIEWDYVLTEAIQIVEDNTDSHGLLVYETLAERVQVDAVRMTDKFQASIDGQTKGTKDKPYTPRPGEAWIPEIILRGGKMPTYQDFVLGKTDEYEDEYDEELDGTID